MAYKNLLTYSGNRIVVSFDGKPIGLCQAVRASDNYGLEDASGIGNIHVIEHVPSKAVHTLSVTNMTLFVGNMADQDIRPQNGTEVMQGMVIDITIFSNDTGAALRSYIACSFESGDVDVTAHRIVIQSGQFKALDTIGQLI